MRALSIAIALAALTFAGCATPPSVSQADLLQQPLRADSDNQPTASIMVTNIRYNGMAVQNFYNGLLKVFQGSRQFDPSGGATAKQTKASALLKDLGYRVSGAASELFDVDKSGVDFLLGATITNVRNNIYAPLAGGYQETGMDVTFELYDQQKKEVVFRKSEDGFARADDKAVPVGDEAFLVALSKILADPAFLNILKSPREPIPQAVSAANAGEGTVTRSIVSDVDSPSYSSTPRQDDFALIVGISKYRDIPEAQFADSDAKAVKKHLIALGYPERNIISLFGDHATKSTLTDKLETWLPLNVKPDSTVFFYYSGHGAPEVSTNQAYLVPWDGDPESLESTSYPMKRLYEKLNALNVKQVIVALDSCFSGAGGRSVLPKDARPLISKIDIGVPETTKLVAFTASRQDQISGTVEAQGHGAFTYYLLRGLNGAAKNDAGHVTVKSLYDYMVPNVEDAAHRHEREQTPQLLPETASAEASDIQLR